MNWKEKYRMIIICVRIKGNMKVEIKNNNINWNVKQQLY